MDASRFGQRRSWTAKGTPPTLIRTVLSAPLERPASNQLSLHRRSAPIRTIGQPKTRAAKRRNQAALRLTVYRRLSRRLASAASVEEIANVVVDELYPTLDYSLVAVQEIRDETLYTLAASGELADRYGCAAAQDLPIKLGIRGRVARTARPALVNDTTADSDYVKPDAAPESDSECCAPIVIDGSVWGILLLERLPRNAFDWYDLLLTDAIVAQIGVAIKRCQVTSAKQTAIAEAIAALSDVLEAKDEYTADHAEKVTQYAIPVAHELGLDDQLVQNIYFCALLHDIGKIGVATEILNKPGALTQDEMCAVRLHSMIGSQMLAKIPALAHIAPLVRAVHERWDGGGYPDGLTETAIPIEASVVAVCDAWHAMVEDRVYRKALPRGEAIEELRQNAGSQFDPQTVRAFLTVAGRLAGGALDQVPAQQTHAVDQSSLAKKSNHPRRRADRHRERRDVVGDHRV